MENIMSAQSMESSFWERLSRPSHQVSGENMRLAKIKKAQARAMDEIEKRLEKLEDAVFG